MAEPNDTVIGNMSLEDFKALDEGKRKELLDYLLGLVFDSKEYGSGYGWSRPPQKQKYLAERDRLHEYATLIEFGTVDSSEIERILDERKYVEIARLRQERPDFGKIPDDFEALSKDLKVCVNSMFAYFDEMRARYQIISIDTHTMANLGLEDKDLTGLKETGILIDEKIEPMPDGYVWSYKLAPAYYECWVSRHYPVEPN
jgi:hypothetical protein